MRGWAILWSLCLVVLIAGAWAVCPEGRCSIDAIDRVGLGLAHAWRSGPLDTLMQGVTWLGSLLLLTPLAFGLAGWLVWQGRRRESGFILLSLLGASILSHVVKLVVARPRPDLFAPWLPMPTDWSYPSAHAMQVTALALALLLIAVRRRPLWAGLLGLIVLGVGLSRIYLQVHFPSDVVVGMLAAALWVAGLRAWIFGNPPAHRRGGMEDAQRET